ncbi:Hpt domain-containing protein [Zoogloea sp.]|uniref:Hpt domain-containing protein n=1 Tax=Zoogloea sp. TaxID=49181 RepID=UPI00262D7828|nr:Hpt domain-containing protein [Zoogloea sp.]MDD3352133.1 Hpt domain-containing protein [Zoogloea sp.]
MSPAHELDLGPLTWVKSEIDLALERATAALAEAGTTPDRLGKVKFAQTHLHQAHGALSIVGLDGLTQFSEQLDRFLGEMASGQIACTPDALRLAGRCIAAIGNYLNELTRGQPDQALRLFRLYGELAGARGQEAPTPGELFFPDLSLRPEFDSPADTQDDPKRLRSLRGRFERGLLKWFRNSQDPSGPFEMRDAAAGIEALQGVPASRAFWLAVTAFFDALGQLSIPVDAGTKRLCGRIDAQMRRVMEGSGMVTERLMRDVLYQVATATAHSPLITRLRQTYQLDRLLPTDRPEIADQPLAPLTRQLREGLVTAREAWSQFASGSAIGLPRFQDALASLPALARSIGQPELGLLLDTVADTGSWLRQDPLQLNDTLSMDVATAMLLVDGRLDAEAPPSTQEAAQQALLVERLKAHQRGEQLPPLPVAEPGSESLHLSRQLAHEILANLSEVEQTLDSYFRAPSQSNILDTVRSPLKQIEGALAVMNEDAAVRLLQDAAGRIAGLPGMAPETASSAFEAIAHRLSALGMYIEALQHGPADLEKILNPAQARAAAATTLEAELAQQKREAAALAAALKDNPEDSGLRSELQLNLETLRQDASLAADNELEKQARQALTMLDAGDLFDAADAPLVPAGTDTPSISPEASRLMDASAEELDAELLGIFIEEAIEVRASVAENLQQLHQAPDDVDLLTTIRRSFHTLKGSSRMVGLKDFGDAAWGVEQTLNHWLRLERPVTPALLALIDRAHQHFSAWVEQLQEGGSTTMDVSALMAEATRLRQEEASPAPLPLEEAAPQPAAAPLPLATELGLEPEEVDLEATVSLAEYDLTATSLNIEPVEPPAQDGALEIDLDFPELSFEAPPPLPAPVDFELDIPSPSEPVPPPEPDSLLVDFELGTPTSPPEPPAGPPPPTADSIEFEFDLGLASPTLAELAEMEVEDIEFIGLPDQAPLDGAAVSTAGLPTTASPEEEDTPASPAGSGQADEDPVASDDEFFLLEALPEPPVEEISLPGLPAGAPDLPVDLDTEVIEVTDLGDEMLDRELADEADLDELIEIEEIEALTGEAPFPDSGETRIATPVPDLRLDEVRLGDVTLSRPLFDLYLAEARQHVATLRRELARLSVNPSLIPPTNAIRAAHTLAGISGTAHFPAPQQLAKGLELAQQRLADHGQPPDSTQSDTLNEAASVLEAMLAQLSSLHLPEPDAPLVERLDAIHSLHLAEVIRLRPRLVLERPSVLGEATPTGTDTPGSTPLLRDELDPDLLPIFLDEGNELLDSLNAALRRWRETPDDPAHASSVARLVHTLKGSARMVGAMNLGQGLHELETRLERARKLDPAGTAITDELEAALDQIRQTLENLQGSGPPAQPAAGASTPEAGAAAAPTAETQAQTARTQLRVDATRIDQFVNEAGEISIARTRIEGELRTLRRSLLDLTENVIRLRNQLREVEIQADSQMQSRLSQVETQHTEFDPLEMDRYTRLQELTRMMAESVGDVTTVQQNLLKNLDGAESALHAQSRMARELQQSLMHVRMVPFDSLAERLYRLVRQTAKELGRRANLDIIGGQIEIDRSVLDAMTGPLGHLVRNAVAHGIEPPEERRAAGKPEIGQITLQVSHEGNEVVIQFRDDGSGLDFERIRARAIANGLINAGEDVDDKRLTNLIFVPGFTTANLSSLAGRGVGMDVVKSETAAVGGRISVDTEAGRGTCFRIHLPLTLAVTQALLVRSGGRTWAIPSSMVAQVQELKAPALEKLREERGTEWLGDHYAYRYLPRLLGDHDSQPQIERFNWVLLLRAGSETLALHVDSLRGNQEVVVKNAGPQYARMVGFSGATVLGDGEIVLILNPVALAGRTPADSDDVPAARTDSPVISQPTIMVVDDSLTVRKITGRLLEREGYRVLTAKDGVDALEQLLSVTPDVVIADIEMPRMDGFDLTRNIRADQRLRDVPIIMITSRTAEKHKRYAEEIGVNHYLGKPYDEDVLLRLIHTFVAIRGL